MASDSPHDSVHDWTKIRDSEMWLSAPLSCSACSRRTNKPQNGNSVMPKEQSHLSCCMCHCTPILHDKRRAGADVVTKARVSFELSINSRFPGGSRKESTLHRSRKQSQLLSASLAPSPTQVRRGEHEPSPPSLSTRYPAMCVSRARCRTLGTHESPDMQGPGGKTGHQACPMRDGEACLLRCCIRVGHRQARPRRYAAGLLCSLTSLGCTCSQELALAC